MRSMAKCLAFVSANKNLLKVFKQDYAEHSYVHTQKDSNICTGTHVM